MLNNFYSVVIAVIFFKYWNDNFEHMFNARFNTKFSIPETLFESGQKTKNTDIYGGKQFTKLPSSFQIEIKCNSLKSSPIFC